ncbi:terminase small subunit [Brevundimonas aveniformis]|uniref:terminase small subunit n=1 Tax=Brevundimonas aveniformis TaxID=370977 RepID=UPI0004260771|nr:terminase small subunit [Brevundimonas aveniformis]
MAPPLPDLAALSIKQRLFVLEYLKDLNATQAAIRAGYSLKTAYSQGQRLLKNVEVSTVIARLAREREERIIGEADDVLRRLWQQFQADPREVVTVRRDACRFCHGERHKYQFTQPEWDLALEAHEGELESARREGLDRARWPVPPNPRGGVGFDPRKRPAGDCPGCHGRGVAVLWLADLDDLSPGASRLVAGVKQTRDGIEVKLVDQMKVTELLARHHGLTREAVVLDVTEGFAEALEAGRQRALEHVRRTRSEAGISSH